LFLVSSLLFVFFAAASCFFNEAICPWGVWAPAGAASARIANVTARNMIERVVVAMPAILDAPSLPAAGQAQALRLR
jgi:hypothetical protein